MSCPGLHCACCAGGITVPVVPIAAALGPAGIAEHLVEVVIVCGVSGALAVAASILLLRRAGRRDDRQLAAWRAAYVARSAPEIRHVVADSVTSAEHPAIAAPQVVINIFGMPSAEQAAIICRAFPGQAGDAITGGK
jgi:hypothetical protein